MKEVKTVSGDSQEFKSSDYYKLLEIIALNERANEERRRKDRITENASYIIMFLIMLVMHFFWKF